MYVRRIFGTRRNRIGDLGILAASASGCRSHTQPHSSALSATLYLVLASSTRGSYPARRVRVYFKVLPCIMKITRLPWSTAHAHARR